MRKFQAGAPLIWLMLLTGCGKDVQPVPAAAKTDAEEPLLVFQEATAAASGIDFQHWCGDGGRYFFPEVMGSGIALLDYDRDGDLDIFVVQGMPPAATGNRPPFSASPTSRLYQQVAVGRFEDVTVEAGLEDHEPYGMGVAVGDVDNDGWPDLYVSKYGEDRLWHNRQGKFHDVTAQSGVSNLRWGTSCCFVDYDRDGWLDLFVVNYVDYFPSQRCIPGNGAEDYCHPSIFNGAPARLFRNTTGEARDSSSPAAVQFQDVSFAAGLDGTVGPGLGVLPADWNEDGWPDLYVANDAKANFLWMNHQGKLFRDEAIPAGAAYDAAGKPQSSMGIAAGDVDGDGRRDLFMTHLDGEYSTLYRQVGGGLFEDQTARSKLAAPTIPPTGFGTSFLDLELDGDLDLVIGNGRVRRHDGASAKQGAAFWDQYREHNQILLNDGSGAFVGARSADDGFVAERRVTRGLAVGDLDNDGDLDVVTTEVNGPARVFLNVAKRQGNWLRVQAVEPQRGGRDALGAIVTVSAGKQRWQRDVIAASSYLSSSDPRVHFGLASVENYDAIEVRWPDGSLESFPGGAANRQVLLQRGGKEEP